MKKDENTDIERVMIQMEGAIKKHLSKYNITKEDAEDCTQQLLLDAYNYVKCNQFTKAAADRYRYQLKRRTEAFLKSNTPVTIPLDSVELVVNCNFIQNFQHDSLNNALDELSERERYIIEMYYYEGKSYREIAREFNVSGNRIAQIKEKALSKLRRPSVKNKLIV